jgi:hypothetical protein
MYPDDKLEMCELVMEHDNFDKVLNRDVIGAVRMVRTLLDKEDVVNEVPAAYLLFGILTASTKEYNPAAQYDDEANLWLEDTIDAFANVLGF